MDVFPGLVQSDYLNASHERAPSRSRADRSAKLDRVFMSSRANRSVCTFRCAI